jgi:2-succinyl-5-enolpyruvyl-6-hydroxy-3-cyclohexene-1-carboxylate synthase
MESRGIVIAGGAWDDGAMARAFGAALGWPVLADALSGARFGAGDGETLIASYDAILRNAHAATVLRPEAVLVFGELPTSKVLRSWLTVVAAPTLHFSALTGNRDGVHGRTRSVHTTPAKVKVPSLNPVACAADWKLLWRLAENAAQVVLGGVEQDEPGFEGAFTRALSRTLERGQTLFVSSSMPVRDLEYFAPVRPTGPRVLANRGANGIDGILSTALGLAHHGEPVVLLTGDLALLHDTNGFLTASRLSGSLTIVVINNAGGGIFGHLPIAQFNPPFDEYWATPQTVDFARLTAAYGVAYEQVGNPVELSARLRAQVGEPGVRVIEVRTDRTQDVATRQKLFAAAAEAAGRSLA